ncbi:Pimeloyl-ACP methyl ester carboxylesterase [Enhydrobacter aerosaccus]|uniref:Pimeloyl-ACP methyl ester carboxylesterase n=1 Tax=Enhydrobacter aerosaccus TaxID=225324 RepID=A0A1T4NP98_9HYPH|nr:alpha/beta hydrolase [Enhydrobacter aerosaccus]SJZ80915.1 Pimeloyl-ACP methyl ester carboxylesterase [Enhydrobacter aerosaccus]
MRVFKSLVVSASRCLLAASLAATVGTTAFAAGPAYGPELEGFDYPFPVSHFPFSSQGEKLEMAYMDVRPDHPNGRTVVLLHGKNFCAATWDTTIRRLNAAGYRVIAPDQVGFCKSSKPAHYQYSFQQLAENTRALLKSLGIEKVIPMGHSTGGMLAVRYALMHPTEIEQLVLVSPIGLEDWKAKGVPWQGVDALYQQERQVTADKVRAYERSTYYAGTWKPEYDKWVEMYAGLYAGSGRDIVAWNSALIYDMIFTQPVFYEFEKLAMPVLLIIGDKDTTAIGKALAPPDVQAKIGHYDVLGKEIARRIPHATLVEFADLGHASFIQDPDRFFAALLKSLPR